MWLQGGLLTVCVMHTLHSVYIATMYCNSLVSCGDSGKLYHHQCLFSVSDLMSLECIYCFVNFVKSYTCD